MGDKSIKHFAATTTNGCLRILHCRFGILSFHDGKASSRRISQSKPARSRPALFYGKHEDDGLLCRSGRYLAEKLEAYRDGDDLVVLALPRGGLPVAYEVATRLHWPLDVFIVRKLGVPGWEELAMGAIASGGARVVAAPLFSSTTDSPPVRSCGPR